MQSIVISSGQVTVRGVPIMLIVCVQVSILSQSSTTVKVLVMTEVDAIFGQKSLGFKSSIKETVNPNMHSVSTIGSSSIISSGQETVTSAGQVTVSAPV